MIDNEIKIERLKFPEDIRRRPGMYVSSTENPDTIYREIYDNCVDEILSGNGSKFNVNITDTYCTVVDDGRGIPIYIDVEELPERRTITHAVLTVKHAGSKFDHETEGYGYSRGMNGIGVKATNALSEKFVVVVSLAKKDLSAKMDIPSFDSDGKIQYTQESAYPSWIIEDASKCKTPVYVLEFNTGKVEFESIIEFEEVFTKYPEFNKDVFYSDWGTAVLSIADTKIFTTTKASVNTQPLSLVKTLAPQAEMIINGEEVKEYNIRETFDKTEFISNEIFSIDIDAARTHWRVFFGYSVNDFSENHSGSVNTIDTPEGYHIRMAQKSLGMALKSKLGAVIKTADAKLGLRIFVLTLCKDPQFSSQTKEKLEKIPKIDYYAVENGLTEAFEEVIKKNKSFFNAWKDRVLEYKREIGKLALKDLVESTVITGNSAAGRRGLGSVVYDCSNAKNRKDCELFIVEGKSAAGTVVQARSKQTHAVLPLRGKPLNSAKINDLEIVLNNAEMKSLINVIGAGIHPFTKLEEARYGKIVTLADADPDGLSIGALLLGTLATYIPEAVDAGMVYMSVMPLYKQGDKYIYQDNEHELDRNKKFSRFKGLGEMSPAELKYTALDPKTRRLVQITMEDIDHAMALLRTTVAKTKLMRKNGIIE